MSAWELVVWGLRRLLFVVERCGVSNDSHDPVWVKAVAA